MHCVKNSLLFENINYKYKKCRQEQISRYSKINYGLYLNTVIGKEIVYINLFNATQDMLS